MISSSWLCRRRIPLWRPLTQVLRRDFTIRRTPSSSTDPTDPKHQIFNATIRSDLFAPTTRVLRSVQTNIHSLLIYPTPGREAPRPNPIDNPEHSSRSMRSYVQVVCTPTADTPGASVLLHFDTRRYLFGSLSEGTQRIMGQQKVGMGKLDEFFVSGPVKWNNTGGMLGLMLTVADILASRLASDPNAAKKKVKTKHLGMPPTTSLKIYGAENITHMLATARRYIFRQGVPLSLKEIDHDPRIQDTPSRAPDFQDMNVKVWFVSLKPDADDKPHGRKRSHDDMVAEDRGQSLPSETTRKEEDRALLKSVVDAMFNSDWQLDALVPTTLYEVQLPATIFVKNEAGEVVNYTGPMPGKGEEPVPNVPVLVRKPWPATKVHKLPSAAPSTQSLSYIVKGQPRRGKFLVEEAVKLGVAKTDYKHLTTGQTVKGKDGMDVTPDMCIAPSVDGRGFAFMDIPDVSYLDDLFARPEWTDKDITGTLEIIFWRLGPGILHDSRLQKFMEERKSIRHQVFAPEASPNGLNLRDAAANMIRSHRIDPDRFPLPVFSNLVRGELAEGVKVAQPGARLLLSPQVKYEEDSIVSPAQTTEALKTMDRQVIKLADEAQKQVSDPQFLDKIEAAEQDIPNRDTEIIALGTGSAIPSKYRNVSATLVRVPGLGSYLFDCGENTLGQLRRMYGFDKTDEILRDLKVVWISHLHADHHLGTASLIAAWRDATAAVAAPGTASDRLPHLTVASGMAMIDWVREYAEVEDIGVERLNLISIMGPRAKETIQNPWVPNKTLAAETGLKSIESVRVDHCAGALACVFNFSSGLKIAYSGDCRPSAPFAQIAQGATLLIHEATLDDELISDARIKKHCTMSEALQVARDMRARRVLLTHFSQRYPKIANAHARSNDAEEQDPVLKDQAIMVAFDMMHVKLGDFRKAELFLPALRQLYEDAVDDDDTPKLD